MVKQTQMPTEKGLMIVYILKKINLNYFFSLKS